MNGRTIGFDLLGIAPEWQERALCSQTDPEAFFPEKGGSTREAKRIYRCEMKAECRYALGHDERFGIWEACPNGSAGSNAAKWLPEPSRPAAGAGRVSNRTDVEQLLGSIPSRLATCSRPR